MTRKGLVLFTLAVGVMVIAGGAFVNKMVEFAITMSHHDIEGFGATAVATYLIGMLPIVFIMLWAVFTGRFRDIEGPKYRMLELQREIDGGLAPRGGRRG